VPLTGFPLPRERYQPLTNGSQAGTSLSEGLTSLELSRKGRFGEATSQDKAGGCAQGRRVIVQPLHANSEKRWLMQLEGNKD